MGSECCPVGHEPALTAPEAADPTAGVVLLTWVDTGAAQVSSQGHSAYVPDHGARRPRFVSLPGASLSPHPGRWARMGPWPTSAAPTSSPRGTVNQSVVTVRTARRS